MFRSMTTSNITDPETAATPMLDALDALTERIEVAFNNRASHGDTSLPVWEAALGALQPGTIVALRGPVSITRALLVQTLLRGNAVLPSGTPQADSLSRAPMSLVVDHESDGQEMVLRMVATQARLSVLELRAGRIQREEWSPLAEAAGFIRELPITIHRSSATIPEGTILLWASARPLPTRTARTCRAAFALVDAALPPLSTDIVVGAARWPELEIFDGRVDPPVHISCVARRDGSIAPVEIHQPGTDEPSAGLPVDEEACIREVLRDDRFDAARSEHDADDDPLGTRPPAGADDR
ncbi:MAG: hypothetical protein A2138_01900 [Deltaproteobacteria bacterium RBG_16_71_12]|nr:MAG: hypothetical protein A2138_01900 [Deltaproteobacteria bacterium RBG_16_71_12]